MERPLMNPIFLRDMEGPPPPKTPLWKRVARAPAFFARLLLTDVWFWRSDRLKIEDGSVVSRLLHVLLYRLLFVPLALVAVVLSLVYLGTHPARTTVTLDPSALGTYFERVSFGSADGTPLEGWVVPVLDAKTVLEKKDKVLKEKNPGVVLVHDLNGNRMALLPLVRPLHDAGYVVMLVSLRGGASSPNAGSTFGLKEAEDVQAAIDLLGKRAEVDPSRVAVLGVGTGANAAALAVEKGRPVAALVLDHPVTNVETLVAEQLAPSQPWLAWLQPTCKWAFELTYRVDIEELDLNKQKPAVAPPPTLMFASRETAASFRPRNVGQVVDFLRYHVPPGEKGRVVTAGVELK